MTTQSNENAHPVFLGAPQIADSARLTCALIARAKVCRSTGSGVLSQACWLTGRTLRLLTATDRKTFLEANRADRGARLCSNELIRTGHPGASGASPTQVPLTGSVITVPMTSGKDADVQLDRRLH